MLKRMGFVVSLMLVIAALHPALAQVMRLADLPTDRIRSLDRSKTVILLPGGILEEHGPYLPAYTDGILSEQLTLELADAVAKARPGWTVLIFPQIALGSNGSNELGGLTDAEKKEEGVSLHGGMDETSLMLHLRPDLVSARYRTAPVVTGHSLQESFDVAKESDWPGYLGSPKLASAELGGKIWRSFAAAAIDQTLRILDGADPKSIRRYSDILEGIPLYKGWIKASGEHESKRDSVQREWLSKKIK